MVNCSPVFAAFTRQDNLPLSVVIADSVINGTPGGLFGKHMTPMQLASRRYVPHFSAHHLTVAVSASRTDICNLEAFPLYISAQESLSERNTSRPGYCKRGSCIVGFRIRQACMIHSGKKFI